MLQLYFDCGVNTGYYLRQTGHVTLGMFELACVVVGTILEKAKGELATTTCLNRFEADNRQSKKCFYHITQ